MVLMLGAVLGQKVGVGLTRQQLNRNKGRFVPSQ